MIYGIILIVVGLLAAYPFVVSKQPNAAAVLDKIAPYQGWIGVVVALWGAWGLISAILNLGLLGVVPIWWITMLAVSLVELAIGFLLGYNLIVKYALSKNPQAAQKGAEVQAKLVGYQTPLGLIAIGLGVWAIVGWMLFM